MRWIFVIAALFSILCINAQMPIFIGLSKDQIEKEMSENYKGFIQNTDFSNKKFKYLKFIDRESDETFLVFLSDDPEICTLTKLMTSDDNEKARIDQLNKAYKKIGNNKWEINQRGSDFNIEVKKEEWYLTIITKPKN